MIAIKFILVILFSLVVVACGGGYGGYSISGTVSTGLAHPLFLSGVTINLTGASMATTTTAMDGSYSFTGLTNGSYTVTPSLSSFTFSPTNIAITSLAANSTANNFVATAIP
jgi:SdrD B-like domain